MKFKKITKNQKGFTLVEVMITALVFAILSMSVTAIFIQVVNLERRGNSAQKIQENTMLTLEMMARDIRVSQIQNQESPNCALTTLTMTHPLKNSVTYRLNNGIIEKSENGGSFNAITGTDVNFTKLNFCVKGSLLNDKQSPRVGIIALVKNTSGQQTIQFNIQTTITSRDVRNEF